MSQNSPNGASASGSKKSATMSRSLSPGAIAASRSGRLGTPGARLSGGGTGRLGSSRLPSFKGQRDLTLGGTAMPVKKEPGTGTAAAENKKKFVPNLKVQRRKEEMKLEVREERKINIPTASKGHARDKQGGKAISLSSSSDGAATNRRPKPELIQTMAGSVFSEGVSGEGIRRKVGGGYGGGSGGGRDSEPLRRPVLSKESKGSVDKEAEEKRLKALLRDDFISDLSSEGLYVPVQLPMIDTGKLFLAEEKDKVGRDEENDDEDVIKTTKKKPANRILDSDDDDDVIPPSPASPSSTLEAEKEKSVKPKTSGKSATEDVDLTFQDLVRQQRGDLIFIQLPDHLPGIAMPVKKEPGTDDDDKANDEGSSLCHLKDLPEGYLGKIQVRRSGKTQLKIGDALLDIDLGTQVGFLQDLVSVDTGADVGASHQEVGDMTVLGRVRHRMVITPDWDHLFKTGGNGGPMGGCDSDEEQEAANNTKL